MAEWVVVCNGRIAIEQQLYLGKEAAQKLAGYAVNIKNLSLGIF